LFLPWPLQDSGCTLRIRELIWSYGNSSPVYRQSRGSLCHKREGSGILAATTDHLSIVKQSEVIAGINQLDTTPWRCIRGKEYSSTILNLGTRSIENPEKADIVRFSTLRGAGII
jgi:hypothetical protein